MGEALFAASSALWLGILTSISPCPLASNIAAMSYIMRRVSSPRRVLWTGLLYAAGRTATYVGLGIVLVSSLLAAPAVSQGLQRYAGRLLGPVLILVGMVLLDLIRLNLKGSSLAERTFSRAERGGLWGALLLGIVFALSFCPVSAALFFGALIPLAARAGSPFLLPSVYGAGTALPVVVFGLVIAAGARSLAVLFNRLTEVERWARRVTGVVFIGAGIYLTLKYVFRLPL